MEYANTLGRHVAYRGSKGEHVRRRVHGATAVRFWASPHEVAALTTDKLIARRYMHRIFEICELDDWTVGVLEVDQDVVGLDVSNVDNC